MAIQAKQLQVVLTTGHEDPERATFALNTALVAASTGVDVTLFLAIKAPEWACEGLPSSQSIQEVASVLTRATDAGVKVEACSVCFDKFCQGKEVPPLRSELQLAGMMTFVRRTLEGVETITF